MTSLVGNAASPVKDGTSSLPRRQSSFARPPLRALYDLLVAPMEGVSARLAPWRQDASLPAQHPMPQPLDTHVDAVLRGPLGCKWGPGLQGGRHRFGPWPVSRLVVGLTLESQVHMRCCSFPAFSSDLGRSGGPGQHASPHLCSQGGRCAHVSSPAHCSSEGLT